MTISGATNLGLLADRLEANASIRLNLGIHHLFTACRAAKRMRAAEATNSGRPFGDFWEEILHDGMVVATSSVACLESYANELYFEPSYIGHSLSAAAAEQLAALVERESIVEKFSTAQLFVAGAGLPKGQPVVQNIECLIQLRNALVHYRSEWSHEAGRHSKLSSRLTGKFMPSAFLPSEQIFPRAWASGSFAEWAIRSVYQFLIAFYDSTHAPSKLANYKEALVELSGCEL